MSVNTQTVLTKAMFSESLHTRFTLVDGESDPYAMELVELAEGCSSPRQEQFSLRFRGDCNRVFQQKIYTIQHDSIGEFDMFVVPIGRDETGTTYEAVFNRLIS